MASGGMSAEVNAISAMYVGIWRVLRRRRKQNASVSASQSAPPSVATRHLPVSAPDQSGAAPSRPLSGEAARSVQPGSGHHHAIAHEVGGRIMIGGVDAQRVHRVSSLAVDTLV